MDLLIKLPMVLIFFAIMIGIGIYCRKNATDVNGFVLGGRSVGPWLTAFAYGTSYFSAGNDVNNPAGKYCRETHYCKYNPPSNAAHFAIRLRPIRRHNLNSLNSALTKLIKYFIAR